MDCFTSRQSFTRFEDLSNEVIYEIFEFLDFDHIYQTFLTLNSRYYHLVNHSTLPIKLNLSSMSKSIFENCKKNLLTRHRIHLIYITNPFIYDLPSSPLHHLLQYLRLETLILENIEAKDLENLLEQLYSLPNLSSLVLIPIDYVTNKSDLYYQIFRLPFLQYCKVSFKERFPTIPLPISTQQISPIKHFVIDNNCSINSLNILLSYLPELRRLSCNNLTGSRIQQTDFQPIILNHLRHLSLKIEDLSFDIIELFLTNLHHQLQVFHFSTNDYITYFNAQRWQQLILSSMPNLRIFHIQLLHYFDFNQLAFLGLSLNQFRTSFWFERKWFFRYEYENLFATFYSIKSSRKNHYILNHRLYQDTYPYPIEINPQSINHISIRGDITTKNDFLYFPNVTELTLLDYLNPSLHSISTILDRLMPLTKLSKLTIQYRDLCISQLIDLLYFSPNIQLIILESSISFSKISLVSIQQTQTFQTIFNDNKIQNMIFKKDSTLESVRLFYKLCPRLEQMTIDLNRYDRTMVMKLIENDLHDSHVPFLCFLNIGNTSQWGIELYLSKHYSIKSVSRHLYIWS